MDRRELALAFTAHEFWEGGTAVLDALASHKAKASFFLHRSEFLDKPRGGCYSFSV